MVDSSGREAVSPPVSLCLGMLYFTPRFGWDRGFCVAMEWNETAY